MRVDIVEATPNHLIALCERLRDREALAFAERGEDAMREVMRTFAQSFYSFAGFIDDRIVVVWGVNGGLFCEDAEIWMIASREWYCFPLTIARHSREIFVFMQTLFKRFHGVVAADFVCGVRWVRWLGFEVGPVEDGFRRFAWPTL